LLRCLLAELKFAPLLSRTSTRVITAQRARLFIGDQAIRFRQRHSGEFHFWDLGEQWDKLVGLPFVYALWLIRPEVRDSKPLAERLRKLRDENLADIDKFVAEEKEFDHDFCRRYYRENLRFNFGEKEKAGLREFNRRCRKQRLLPQL
jgi:chorismate dehydratase